VYGPLTGKMYSLSPATPPFTMSCNLRHYVTQEHGLAFADVVAPNHKTCYARTVDAPATTCAFHPYLECRGDGITINSAVVLMEVRGDERIMVERINCCERHVHLSVYMALNIAAAREGRPTHPTFAIADA